MLSRAESEPGWEVRGGRGQKTSMAVGDCLIPGLIATQVGEDHFIPFGSQKVWTFPPVS